MKHWSEAPQNSQTGMGYFQKLKNINKQIDEGYQVVSVLKLIV